MKVPASGLRQDEASLPLLLDLVSYQGITSGNGNAGGTTLVCADLVNEPGYTGHLVKILSGPASGQADFFQTIVAGTGTVYGGFVTSTGVPIQIITGTRFAILSFNVAGLTTLLMTWLAVPPPNSLINLLERDVIGNKADTATQVLVNTASLMRYIKGLVDILVTDAGITTWLNRSLPGNGVSLSEAVRWTTERKPEWHDRISGIYTTTNPGTEETILTTAYTVPGLFYFNLTLRNMVALDDFTIRVYKRVDGANYDLKSEQNFVGSPTLKVYEIEDLYTDGTEFVRITIQSNGQTNRAFPYSYNFIRPPVI